MKRGRRGGSSGVFSRGREKRRGRRRKCMKSI